MSLDRETRNDVEKMINDKNNYTENLLVLKMDNLNVKLDMMNQNIVNYINEQEVIKSDIQDLKNKYLLRDKECPFRETIIDNNRYIHDVKTIKTYTIKLVSLAAILITIINAILIYIKV